MSCEASAIHPLNVKLGPHSLYAWAVVKLLLQRVMEAVTLFSFMHFFGPPCPPHQIGPFPAGPSQNKHKKCAKKFQQAGHTYSVVGGNVQNFDIYL
jgi:hypothetical protein